VTTAKCHEPTVGSRRGTAVVYPTLLTPPRPLLRLLCIGRLTRQGPSVHEQLRVIRMHDNPFPLYREKNGTCLIKSNSLIKFNYDMHYDSTQYCSRAGLANRRLAAINFCLLPVHLLVCRRRMPSGLRDIYQPL